MRIFLSLILLFFVSNLNAQTVRVVSKTDGSLTIITLVKGEKDFDKEQQKRGLSGRPFKDFDSSSLPTDKKYRNAWVLENEKIEIDEAKKNDINIRIEKERLKALEDKALEDQAKINLGLWINIYIS